ncbi:hypothetical protein K470DRAFT_283131 [Piedraia hortae CBS 480.64]|uniref:Tr-type G domain-containing protein n=1 Tax=Piedraia hortae CBS 480.64 TaxID=1314780 RepID=A0A6A7BTL8_9PEZI|nr:hypothetical protein K470DRAFT_283131 [Piedraia hortae CBS 480.64]
MQRVKKVDYDEDELYDDLVEEYTAEDCQQFAILTPVVKAELEEAGLQSTDKEVEEALWHYYWDVQKSVNYLKHVKRPKSIPKPETKQSKSTPKSRFDEGAKRNAKTEGKRSGSIPPLLFGRVLSGLRSAFSCEKTNMLGGSSKLSKLAEERRKKAESAQSAQAPGLNSLDRLIKAQGGDEAKQQPSSIRLRKIPLRPKHRTAAPETLPYDSEKPEEKPQDTSMLRASPTAFGRFISLPVKEHKALPQITLKDVTGCEVDIKPFLDPSPDTIVLQAQKKRKGITKRLGKSTPNANALARETEKLSVEDKPAKKALNVLKLWQEVKLPSVAFVVIGHVDHGKSTLMGRLLLDSGAVQQRDVDKYQKQAGEMGKSSFALAWVMDTDPEERERGVTVGIAQHHISTEKAAFTILDAPGHRDFVPNMIAGVSMADFAVIVVDVSQLESGMKGQTREHIVLAKAAGLTRVIVAINKLDSIKPEAWDFEVYKAVRDEVATFLRKTGFEDEHVQFTACSGLKGENVVRKGSAAWLSEDYPTLLQALEKAATSETTPERIESSLEMQVADVYRGGIANFLSISGRIASGHVQVGDTIMIQPSGESALIKGIEVNDETQEWSAAGQIPILHLTDMDANHVQPGDMVYCPSQLIPLVKEFEATVNTLQSLLPQRLDLHLGRLHVSAFVKQLTALLNEKGEVIKNKPRVVQPEQRARVVISLAEGIPVGKSLAVILRSEGSTVAYGHVHSAALSST